MFLCNVGVMANSTKGPTQQRHEILEEHRSVWIIDETEPESSMDDIILLHELRRKLFEAIVDY